MSLLTGSDVKFSGSALYHIRTRRSRVFPGINSQANDLNRDILLHVKPVIYRKQCECMDNIYKKDTI